MKKISIYFLLFCMGLMVVSCVEPLTPQPVLPGGSYEISLSTICISPNTKADEPQYPILVPGVDSLNENKISHIDYFVYKNGQTVPVEHGRVSQDSVVISMTEAVGAASGIDGFVYVIANLPVDQYRHDTTNGFQVYADGAWSTITALDTASLKNLEVVASFNTLVDGKFKKQDNFVMSGDVKYSLTTTTPKAKVTAELDRLASKITLDLSVVPAIDELQTLPNGDVIYVQTWYPVLEDIDIYLSYADNHAELRGTPEYYTTNFFTYNREGFKAKYSCTNSTDTTFTVPNVTPVWTNENWKWSVSGLASPFYTYPIEWRTEDNTAPFIKIILPWAPYDESSGIEYETIYDEYNNPYQKFLTAGRTKTTRKGPDQEFYYKIALPSKTKDESTGRLQLLNNDWYNLVLEVAILGGTSDDLPLEVAGQYYVVDWNAPSFTAGGSLAQGRYLDVARDTFYIYGGNSIEIPVSSSHNLDANLTRITSAQRWNARTSAWQTINRGSVEVNGRSSVTFTNNLVTAMGSTLDCYMMKFDVTISQPVPTEAGQVRKEKQITIIQYPAIYVDSKPGGNVMIDGFYGNVDNHYHSNTGNNPGGNSGTSTSTTTETPYAPISRYVDQQKTMTIISISSLANNPKYLIPGQDSTVYLITDPRQPSGFSGTDLERHYSGDYNQTNNNTRLIAWTNDEAGKIKVGSTTDKNFIAPRFMISSRWGRMGNWNPPGTQAARFETVQKRCATYQEAGYPAGRWRLPTEAEIMFIASLQRYSFIDALFTTTGPSISASGGVFTVSTNSVGYAAPGNNDGGRSCRCVYDLWYWGDEPVAGAKSTYTIMP